MPSRDEHGEGRRAVRGHPYRSLPDHAFWRRAVEGVAPDDFDPVVDPPFKVGPGDRVATAGSCFAQHIARTLANDGFHFLVTERPSEAERAMGAETIYSARYGNVYTTLQLKQLFDRAYGLGRPQCEAWTRNDGRVVDCFRPTEQPLGFATIDELRAARAAHLARVREVFETCDVFVFTLGLTECWVCDQDGFASPIAPYVAGSPPDGFTYSFRNLPVSEMAGQLDAFLAGLREVNPGVRVVLTVSPVPLAATYENQNVLVATTYSKSALRVVADMAARSHPGIAYFPSYEMVTMLPGAQSFEADLRSVRPDAVARVMRVFRSRFTTTETGAATAAPPAPPASTGASGAMARASVSEFANIVCDEDLLHPEDRG